MVDDYRQMWQEIGLDLDAHDGLLAVLPPLYGEVIIGQEKRPARMAYFDEFFSEIHGRRIKELVGEKARGGSVVGTFCTYVPEEIILALGASAIGLCGGADVAGEEVEKYLPRNLCPLIKSSLGFKLAKICPYTELADILIGETTCDGKKKYYEILGEHKDVYVMELPQKKNEGDRALWRDEVASLSVVLEELTGHELEPDKLREAVGVVNDKRRALLRLAEVRKADPPVISGKDALLISQMAFFDEPRRFANKVNELCGELEKRTAAGEGVAEKGAPRIENVLRLASDYRVDGVIYYALMYCAPYSVESYKVRREVESAGVPLLYVETDYGRADTAQLSTRVNAFLEMIKGC